MAAGHAKPGPSQDMARRQDGLGSVKGRGWKGERKGACDPEVLAYGIGLHRCKKEKKKESPSPKYSDLNQMEVSLGPPSSMLVRLLRSVAASVRGPSAFHLGVPSSPQDAALTGVIRYGCYSDPGEGESGTVWGKQCPSEQVRKTLLIVTWPAAKVPWDHEQGRRGEQTWGQRAHQESPRLGTWKKLQGAAGFGKEYTV